jgi:hypothetical protein
LVEVPRQASVAALEEHSRVAARVEEPVHLPRDDRPDALQRLLRPLWELHTLRLLPLAGRVVGDEDLRAVEPGGDGGEVTATAGVADRELDRVAGERAGRDLER